jgi:hypothetical protein
MEGSIMDKRIVILLACIAMTGCATPVTLSILGGGTSAMVSHNLKGSVDRTFTSPLALVHQATIAALDAMGVAIEGASVAAGATIRASAADRSIEITFERLGDNLTAMRASARKAGMMNDNATASEIISQTERALEVFAGEAPAAVSPAASIDRQIGPPGGVSVYIVNLENIVAGSGQKPKPVPSRLQEYVLFTTESEHAGRRTVHVNLGYFASEAEAAGARKLALDSFPLASVGRLHQEQASAAPPATKRQLRAPAYRLIAASYDSLH